MKWLFIALWVFLCVYAGVQAIRTYAEERYALKVLSTTGHKAIIQPYVAPTIDVEVQSGKPGTYLEGCQQVVTDRKFQDHVETVVTLKCEHGVVLEVKGLHLQ